MIQEPEIVVKCDKCGFEEKFNLAHGEPDKFNITEFDDSNVEEDMKSAGWVKIDGKDICPTCKKEMVIVPTMDRPILDEEIDITA